MDGKTFPIHEESIVPFHKNSLHFEDYARSPEPVEGIGKALKTKSFLVDLSYTFDEEVKVGDEIFVAAGTRINPLDEMELSLGLLFFDGTDAAQIAWAKRQPPNFLWILVNGSPLELESEHKRDVYFDQFGLYTSKLNIKAVPAKASQQGGQMLVEEFFIDEKGEER